MIAYFPEDIPKFEMRAVRQSTAEFAHARAKVKRPPMSREEFHARIGRIVAKSVSTLQRLKVEMKIATRAFEGLSDAIKAAGFDKENPA